MHDTDHAVSALESQHHHNYLHVLHDYCHCLALTWQCTHARRGTLQGTTQYARVKFECDQTRITFQKQHGLYSNQRRPP